jgi:glutaryl-CoA dehydrogenase
MQPQEISIEVPSQGARRATGEGSTIVGTRLLLDVAVLTTATLCGLALDPALRRPTPQGLQAAGLVACATAALTNVSWTEAFLVGALLSPTDPVLSSSVVTNPRVPRIVRHSLNLESVITYEGTETVHELVVGKALTGTGGAGGSVDVILGIG